MKRIQLSSTIVAIAALALAPAAALAHGRRGHHQRQQIKHVLLLNIDGFHPFDLANYAAAHPDSALASFVQHGVVYSNAETSRPSDSFPALLGMITGGSPSSTGVYYDNTYSRRLSPPGSDCSTRGTEVEWKQNLNKGGKASGSLISDIDPAKLPLDPDNGCTPFWPHQYLKVNDVFNVAHDAGLRTAYSDKHPAYEIVEGPSGNGVDDFYSPEFYGAKKSITLIMQNDELRVDAILNQIDGYDHARTQKVGVPAIFGMNFQAINIAQKFSGYADADGNVPNSVAIIGSYAGQAPGLAQALDYVNDAIGRMITEIANQGLTDSTMIILAAKSGNSPVDASKARLIPPDTITSLINSVEPNLAAQVTADTAALIWLTDPSKTQAVAQVLRDNADLIGATKVYAGAAAIDTMYHGTLAQGPVRRPDIIIDTENGVIYDDPGKKLTEHGGFHPEDVRIAMAVLNPAQRFSGTVNAPVSERQIAPTILKALGLNPRALQAVRIEHTRSLPGISFRGRR